MFYNLTKQNSSFESHLNCCLKISNLDNCTILSSVELLMGNCAYFVVKSKTCKLQTPGWNSGFFLSVCSGNRTVEEK